MVIHSEFALEDCEKVNTKFMAEKKTREKREKQKMNWELFVPKQKKSHPLQEKKEKIMLRYYTGDKFVWI